MTKVLARGQRALLIAGVFHLIRPPAGQPWSETGIIERRYPGSIFTVKPHDYFGGPDWAELERRIRTWPRPSLAVTRGTWLGAIEPESVVYTSLAPGSRRPPFPNRLEDAIDGYLVLGLPA